MRTLETVCVQHETAESTKKEAKNPLKQRRIVNFYEIYKPH